MCAFVFVERYRVAATILLCVRISVNSKDSLAFTFSEFVLDSIIHASPLTLCAINLLNEVNNVGMVVVARSLEVTKDVVVISSRRTFHIGSSIRFGSLIVCMRFVVVVTKSR